MAKINWHEECAKAEAVIDTLKEEISQLKATIQDLNMIILARDAAIARDKEIKEGGLRHD